jgi:hypothetical protein
MPADRRSRVAWSVTWSCNAMARTGEPSLAVNLRGTATLRGLKADARNGKGCDIGYALAASSCEGAYSVDACTVTALDAITAFAVPNPNCPSQSRRFFQVWLLFGSPRRVNHSAYFRLAKFYFGEPFQPSTEATLTTSSRAVNAAFRCKL